MLNDLYFFSEESYKKICWEFVKVGREDRFDIRVKDFIFLSNRRNRIPLRDKFIYSTLEQNSNEVNFTIKLTFPHLESILGYF